MDKQTQKHNQVDFGIITFRSDEFTAVLNAFSDEVIGDPKGQRTSSIRSITTQTGGNYHVAIIRTPETGNTEAQSTAEALIKDVHPKFILSVGIGGGIPHDEFCLGDVIVSESILNYTKSEELVNGETVYGPTAKGLHPDASDIVAHLPARILRNWNSNEMVGESRSGISYRKNKSKGSSKWQEKIKDKFSVHRKRKDNKPCFYCGTIISSDQLMKDPEKVEQRLRGTRQFVAIDMESAGIHTVAHNKNIPFIAIRGISDIVGYERSDKWLKYACLTAASFVHALLKTEPIVVLDKSVKFASEPEFVEKFRSVVELSKLTQGKSDG